MLFNLCIFAILILITSHNRRNHKNHKADSLYYINYLIFNKNELLYQIYMRYYESHITTSFFFWCMLYWCISLWYCHSNIYDLSTVTNTAKNNDVMHVTRCTFYLDDSSTDNDLLFHEKLLIAHFFNEKCQIRSRFNFFFVEPLRLGKFSFQES